LVLLIVVLPLSPPAQASLWDDLWQNNNQQAQKQLEAGNAEDAAALFEDTEWRAVARYRARDFAGSAAEFAESGDARNLYNLGNAMAFQGEFDSAIDAYEQVLEMDPDNDDAAYNLELVRNLKDQQQQEQQQGQGEDQQSTEDPGGEGEQSDSEGQPEQEGSEGGIPDDPGGLLRRKFRHQYQRSGKDQDGNDVWPDDEVQPW
jgi:Ca-activated chloride channel family protein